MQSTFNVMKLIQTSKKSVQAHEYQRVNGGKCANHDQILNQLFVKPRKNVVVESTVVVKVKKEKMACIKNS